MAAPKRVEDKVEEYWSSSSVSKKKYKVNMFDDNVTVEAASDMAKFRKNLQSDDLEDEDTIGWDDTPTRGSVEGSRGYVEESRGYVEGSRGSVEGSRGSVEGSRESLTSQRSQTAMSPASTPNLDPGFNKPSFVRPDATFQRTHNRSRSDVLVGSMSVMSMSKSPSIQDTRLSSEPSIDSIVGTTQPSTSRRGPVMSNHDAEKAFLIKELENAQRLGGVKLSVDETIKRMTSGMSFQLEQYKGKEEKLALLDKAIAAHDGNAIIAIVIFLKRTLKNQLFNYELQRRPQAVDHYLAYLKIHWELKELEDILGMLGRTEELAILKYKQTVSVLDPVAKIDRLKTCNRAHFQQELEQDSSLIQQQIDLLMRQRPVEVSDALTESEGKHPVFRHIPRKASIINMPVITTLYYLCLYHYEEPENLLSSPLAVKQSHQLSEKQYVWTAVKARARLRKWDDIEKLLTTKGWFGGTKLKSVIGFEKIAAILHKAGAPSDKTSKYLMLMDDIERRLTLAQKMDCHTAAIDTFVAQKDKRMLEAHYARLKPNTQEWFYAKDALSSTTIKWK